jgi:hypothetical protein
MEMVALSGSGVVGFSGVVNVAVAGFEGRWSAL